MRNLGPGRGVASYETTAQGARTDLTLGPRLSPKHRLSTHACFQRPPRTPFHMSALSFLRCEQESPPPPPRHVR